MIAEHPVTGAGIDRFKAFYMTGQAAYFEQNPDSPEAMVAGDVNYAFNDFLQHTVENGLTGFVLMLCILTVALRVATKQFNELAWIAKAGITGIAVFAFFSYPAQVLPIKMSLTLYLACLASLSEQKTLRVLRKFFANLAVKKTFKYVLAICIAFGLIAGYHNLNVERTAWKNWNQAYRLYTMSDYAGCLPYYEKAWPVLQTDGDYLTNYGKALSMAGEHERAVAVLQQAVLYYPNIIVYTALGDSYKAMEKPLEAEQSYLTAWYMNPSRFLPKYLLAKLYDETGQTEKAMAIARELLHKEVKVRSTAINEIREEMEKILKKYQD
jgi:tetratricopeptide (TPR) repeat protein